MENFSSVDAAWLHMDSPTNLAVITGVMSFEGQADLARLRLTIERRLMIHRRFMQRARPPAHSLGLPRWEFDPHFDFDYHLQVVHLPEPADHAALQDFVGQVMSRPLDLERPLWQMFYVPECGAGSALVCRLHHCIADGMALVQLMLLASDVDPDAGLPEAPAEPPAERPRLLVRLLRPAAHAIQRVDDARRLAGSLVADGVDVLVHPSRLVDTARMGADFTLALGKLLLIGPDRRTSLRGRCGVEKRAAWSVALPLEQVKAVGYLMGGTVNDVLLSAVTGALQRYLAGRGEATEGLNIRAIVPVNLRPPDDPDLFGNRFGLVFLSLPVGQRDPLRRLVTLRRRMDEIKDSPEAIAALGILGAMGLSPTQIETIVLRIFGMKGTAVMTNVPGPRQALYFAGQKIDSLMFWVPTPGNLGLGVSIISYADQVILGVATDAGLIPDPQALLDAFHDEVMALMKWGRRRA